MTIVADSPRHARDLLRNQGVLVETLRPVQVEATSAIDSTSDSVSISKSLRRFARSLSARSYGSQVTGFTREISTLLRVGTPLVDAFQLMIDQSNGPFKYMLLDIREQLTSGSSLATAVRRHRLVFDPVLCEMITVGEQSGALSSVLKQTAEFREHRDRLKDRVFSAILYPSIVFLLSIVVTIFLMTVVAPTLISSLEEMQKELPWPTRLLKALSDGLIHYGVYLTIAVSFVALGCIYYVRSQAGRVLWDRSILRVPVLGALVMKQNCSRLCMVTATLLRSGVELVRALEIGKGAVTNSAIANAIETARQRVSSGTDLGAALSSHAVIPPTLIQVFALGQQTGQLEELLFQIAEDYNHQVNTLAERLTSIMEPVLIVALSIIVGFILMATLLPILEAGNVISES
jgi:type II secretory pathway component PulF